MTKYKYIGDDSFALSVNGEALIIQPNEELEISDEDYANISWCNLFAQVEEVTSETVARKKPTKRE